MSTYMMLIYAPTEAAPADDPGNQIARWVEFNRELHEAGVHLADHRLQDVSTATTVRVRGGETLVSDGPFAETKEYLAGYYLLECSDLDEVLRIAARVPHIHYGSVEIRPVLAGPSATDVASG